jgi:multiple sugar transport system substrate-binding protein
MLPSKQQTMKIIHQSTAMLMVLGIFLSACSPVSTQITPSPESTGKPAPLAETKGAASTTIPTPIPSATIPVELSKLKDIEVKIIHPWMGQTGVEFYRLIQEFNQENVWKIKVDAEQGGSVSETNRLFTESLISSDQFDMVVTSPEHLTKWNTDGIIIDLSNFISNPEWGIPEKEKTSFITQTWTANTSSAKQIGIPAQVNLHFLVYNQTWAEELGFATAPTTQEDFREQVCAAAIANNNDSKQDNDGTGGWIINSSSATLLSWINAFDGSRIWMADPLDLTGQTEMGDAFLYLRGLMEKGCAWNSRVASPFTYFSERQTLAFSATLPDLLELEELLAYTKNTDNWIMLPYPGEKEPEPVLMSGLSYGISKTEPIRELASWLFLRWLMLPRNQARLAEAAGTIPPSSTAADLLEVTAVIHPWWKEARSLVSDALVLPASSDWRQLRPVLEDGFWQMLQPTPLAIPTLLQQMDDTIKAVK